MRIGWRLGIVLALLGATAVVLQLAPPVKAAVNPALILGLPTALGEWSGTDGIPEDVLPADPSEKVSVRRTYRSGSRVAWVAVSLFVSQDEESRRGSINKVYPQRNVSLIEAVPFEARLGTSADATVPIPAVMVHLESERLLVAYWHQIGRSVYGSEYRFRLALMRDRIFSRRADSLLVRIATPRGHGGVADDLALVESVAPAVYGALTQDMDK